MSPFLIRKFKKNKKVILTVGLTGVLLCFALVSLKQKMSAKTNKHSTAQISKASRKAESSRKPASAGIPMGDRQAADYFLSNAEIVTSSGGQFVSIHMPKVLFDGKVCSNYNRLRFQFAAEGIAVDGERPIFEVTAKCEYVGDYPDAMTVKIPLKEVLDHKPLKPFTSLDGSFKFTMYEPLAKWPLQWQLMDLTLFHEQIPTMELNVFDEAMARKHPRKIFMFWQLNPAT